MTQKAREMWKDDNEPPTSFTRRTLLLSASSGLLVAAAPALARADEQAITHTAHGQYQGLATAALNCVGWGEQCQKHIMRLFASGDTSLTQCSVRIQDMIAVCSAVASLAAAESEYLKPLVKVCVGVCESCEKECRKHEQQHAICKDTAEACAQFVLTGKQLV